MSYHRELIGKTYPSKILSLSAATGAAFIAATDDTTVGYLGDQRLLPPWIVCVLILPQGVAQVVRDPLLHDDPEHSASLLHFAEDMRWHRRILSDEIYVLCSTLQAIEPHALGTLLQVRSTLSTPRGALVSETLTTLFTRKRLEGAGVQKRHRPTVVKAPTWQETWQVSPDQADRYAKASGDNHVIHISDQAARRIGLKERILHGMCSLSFAGRAVLAHACGGDPSRLRRLRAEFARPVYLNDTLVCRGANNPTASAVEFAVTNQSGKAVLSDGLAEVEDLSTGAPIEGLQGKP